MNMTIKCSSNRSTKVIRTVNGAMLLMDIEHRDKPQNLDIHLQTIHSYCYSDIDLLLKTFSHFSINSLMIFFLCPP